MDSEDMIMAAMSLTAFWVGTTSYDTPAMRDNMMMGARVMSMSTSDGAGVRDGRYWPHGVYLYCIIGLAQIAQHCTTIPASADANSLPPLRDTPPLTPDTTIGYFRYYGNTRIVHEASIGSSHDEMQTPSSIKVAPAKSIVHLTARLSCRKVVRQCPFN